MAGDWIPMRLDLAEDPAVIAIATATQLSEMDVVGRLHRLWAWANSHLETGHADVTPMSWVDRLVVTPGFAQAMLDAGWLTPEGTGFAIPKFDLWNSQSAKRRLLAARRKRRERSHKSHAEVVTKTRPEKRREEKSRGKKKEASASCPEPAKPPASGPMVPVSIGSFPVVGTGPPEWHLAPEKLVEYRAAFPGVDVESELRKARQWLLDNPTRRKTFAGMTKFLGGWLGRAQDRTQGDRRVVTKGEAQGEYMARVISNIGGSDVGPKDL